MVAQALRFAQFGWNAPRVNPHACAVNGTALTIPFTQDALSPVGALTAAKFTVTVNGTPRTVSAAAVTSATLVTLTLASAVVAGDVVVVNYATGGAAPLKDAANDMVPAFTASVKNNTP